MIKVPIIHPIESPAKVSIKPPALQIMIKTRFLPLNARLDLIFFLLFKSLV